MLKSLSKWEIKSLHASGLLWEWWQFLIYQGLLLLNTNFLSVHQWFLSTCLIIGIGGCRISQRSTWCCTTARKKAGDFRELFREDGTQQHRRAEFFQVTECAQRARYASWKYVITLLLTDHFCIWFHFQRGKMFTYANFQVAPKRCSHKRFPVYVVP